MGKEDQILVVDKNYLFEEYGEFFGFISHDTYDFESKILCPEKYYFTRRGTPEENPSISAEANVNLKQPIRYVVIVNPNLKKIFAFRRKSMKEDPTKVENRLAGKWSWGAGGHIEQCDHSNDGNLIHSSMNREIGEEVEFVGGSITKVLPLGYVNEDDDVGKVHFGILYLLETDATEVRPKQEFNVARFHSLNELKSILSDPELVVEGWSKIAFDPLKKYFAKLN